MSDLPEKGNEFLAPKRLMNQPVQSKLLYSDLCVNRKTWHPILLTSLFNVRMDIFPVVKAAANEPPKIEPPKKPPPMRYKDLPLGDYNEFLEYKTYHAEKHKCPKADVKLLQTFLCPIVHNTRMALGKSIFGMTDELCLMKREACEAACKNIRCFKKFMRHPDNLLIRRAIVVLSTLTGLYIGSGTRGITRKLLFGTAGALAAGALCFPKETDVIFRNTTYNIVTFLLTLYNCICGKDFSMRRRMPCIEDLPPPPPARQPHQINKACEDLKARAEAKAKAKAEAAAKDAAARAEAIARAAAARKKIKCRDE